MLKETQLSRLARSYTMENKELKKENRMEITREDKINYMNQRMAELKIVIETSEKVLNDEKTEKRNVPGLKFIGNRYKAALECFKDLKKFYEQEQGEGV